MAFLSGMLCDSCSEFPIPKPPNAISADDLLNLIIVQLEGVKGIREIELKKVEQRAGKQKNDTGTKAEPDTKTKNYIKMGSTWQICFEGEIAYLNGDLVGLPLIGYLLQNPGKSFSAFDLERLAIATGTRKTYKTNELELAGNTENDEDEQVGLTMTPTGDTINSRELAEVDNDQLKELIRVAKEKRDNTEKKSETEAFDGQIDILEKELKLRTNKWGKARPIVGDKFEQARIRVAQNIILIKTKILEDRKNKLYQHLESYLKTGGDCSYNPISPTNWEIS
jgi:hypothetical protein